MRIFLLIILSGCTSVFYQPTRFLYATPKALQISHEDVFFDSSDGKRLHGWYLQHKGPKSAKGLITLFHGNAQNLSSHFLNLAWITEHGFDVFIFDYRGYGLSIGTPTPEGVNQDALAALEKSYEFVKTKNIPMWVVHAQSLGGLIAMRSLEDYKNNDAIDLLVLDSTFNSYDDIAFDKLTSHWLTFLFSPLGPLLVSDSMAPNIFFKQYSGNVLVMHGRQDRVIPIKFGRGVFERINGVKKTWWEIEDGKHIDTFNSAKGDSYKSRYLMELSTINGAKNQSRK